VSDAPSVDPIAELLERCAALSLASVIAVFTRYGRPLDDPEPALDPCVELGDAVRLGRLRHRAPVDVIANDHFVLLRPSHEALAVPGPLLAAAVAALAMRA